MIRYTLTLLAAALLTGALTGCGAGGLTLVTYEVTGAGITNAAITYVKAASDPANVRQTQHRNAGLPWSRRVALKYPGKAALSATNVTGQAGTLTCRILHGDTLITEASSAGTVHCAAG